MDIKYTGLYSPDGIASYTGGAARVSIANGYLGPESHVGDGLAPIDIGASSTASAAITGTTVDVTAEEDCFIAIAAAPTATTSDYFLAANTTYRLPITSGNKIAVIQNAAVASKSLHIHPVS